MPLKRVAYVVNVFPKISETFIAHELAELRRRGVELRVCSLRRPTESIRHRFIADAGLEAVTSYETAAFPRLLRGFKPELLHAHFATEPAAAAWELAAGLRVPFTFTAHGYDIRHKAPPDFAQRAAAARAVITVSEANRRHIAQTFGVAHERIEVIPSGVDTRRCRPATPARGPNRVPLIVCVARHVKVKNLNLLLEACAELLRRRVRFRCVSVGGGVCRAELEQQRSRLGLEEVVEFVGPQEHTEVVAWWQRADIAVLTSQSEGMPVCLMEAAACSVPAVATGVGGVPELIQHGITGLVTPPGQALALAEALQELLTNSTRATEMGRAARRRAEEQFSLERQVDSLLTLWSRLIG
jgi:glycosyltransferase involved in cell wall biosynthesis